MTTKSIRKRKPSLRQLTGELAETSTALTLANDTNAGLIRELQTTRDLLRESERTVRCQAITIEFDRETQRQFRDAAAQRDQRYREDNDKLRRRVQELEGQNSELQRRFSAEVRGRVNSSDAAAVLAYLTMPTGSLPDILANFNVVASKLDIGPEVKAAATEAISRASTAFVSGEWPDDKLKERLLANVGGDDLLGLISSLVAEGGGAENLGGGRMLVMSAGHAGRRGESIRP